MLAVLFLVLFGSSGSKVAWLGFRLVSCFGSAALFSQIGVETQEADANKATGEMTSPLTSHDYKS